MSADRAARRALFGLLFLCSGAAGLIYETVWIRELQHFFGSTIHSITTVVAAYMGGLGLGAWVMGRRADGHRNPARLYGILELAIGAFGLASPWIFRLVGDGYIAFARGMAPGLWAATTIKFVAAFLVMLVPTFLMGGTLPILTRAFAGAGTANLRRELALFYGLNTVGGVAGAALAGYVLIEYVGQRPSLVACGMLNLLLGVAALVVARRPGAVEPPPPAEDAAAVPLDVPDPVRRVAIWLIGITAFASLLYEIAWTRVLVLVVGSSTYAFTTILVCFLLGIGLGSLVAIGRGRSVRELLVRAAMVQGAIAILASLLFPFFRALPVYIVATLRLDSASATQLLLLQGIALAAVIIPPALGMGLAFPLLTELAARRGGSSGSEAGRAYLANTLGSIAGSVVTGFLLVHTIGAERTLQIGVVINVVAAVGLVWSAAWRTGEAPALREGERAPLLLGALALIVALLTPSWSSRLLDRGPSIYGHGLRTRAELDNFLRGFGAEQLLFDEGWNATISVWRNGASTWLKSNGKADASSVADMNTQVLLGILPALAHPHPARVFVIGLGSGATTRAAADMPGVEHVDVVEIERAVVAAQPFFSEVNRDVLADPRVRLIENDAREALQVVREPYDVIMSEPSNPWIAGIATLYTPEFFRVAKGRMAPGGVFGQWVQTYRVPVGVVSVVVANMRQVFAHVEMWYANGADLILLASDRPIVWDHARVASHLDPATPTGRAFRDWLEVSRPSDLLGRFLLGEAGTARLAADAAFAHSDDRPKLEFVAARGLLALEGRAVFDSLVGVREASGDTLPALRGWALGPGEWQAAFAASLPPDNALALRMAERAQALAPRDPERTGLVGLVHFGREDFRESVPYLREGLRGRPADARLLLPAGIATIAIGQVDSGVALLRRSRAAGGDSVYAMSVMAEALMGLGRHAQAAELALQALRVVRPTIAAPFPGALQTALRRLAAEAPPDIAAPVFEEAIRARPSWDLGYQGGAQTYKRWGGEHCRRAAELASELERFGWTDREIVGLLHGCGPRGAG